MTARYLLDTNHAGVLLRDANSPVWARLASMTRDDCVLCRPVVAELWYMVFNSERVEANRAKLEALLAQFDVVELDERSAIEFGTLRAAQRRKGKPIPSFDALIAAIARANALTIVTGDSHFRDVDGIALESWLTT